MEFALSSPVAALAGSNTWYTRTSVVKSLNSILEVISGRHIGAWESPSCPGKSTIVKVAPGGGYIASSYAPSPPSAASSRSSRSLAPRAPLRVAFYCRLRRVWTVSPKGKGKRPSQQTHVGVIRKVLPKEWDGMGGGSLSGSARVGRR